MAISTQRASLMSQSDSFKKSLKENLEELKNNSEQITKAALIGGGVLLGGYLLFKLLKSADDAPSTAGNDKLVLVNAPKESYLSGAIKKAVLALLLAYARQKLMEYLDSRNKEVEE